MFAKLARFQDFGRRRAMPPQATHCNDNHPAGRLAAVARRAPRPVLVCGWRVRPATGRLECFWQVCVLQAASADATAADEPGMSWMIGPLQRLFGAGLAREPVGARAAVEFGVFGNRDALLRFVEDAS